jgi:hypothetical protein
MITMQSVPVETVQETALASRLLTYIKENRIEMIGIVILAHLLGVSDRIIAQVSGVCF